MEYRTCEEYVLHKLQSVEDELGEIKMRNMELEQENTKLKERLERIKGYYDN